MNDDRDDPLPSNVLPFEPRLTEEQRKAAEARILALFDPPPKVEKPKESNEPPHPTNGGVTDARDDEEPR
ncbi:MAG TPA: hypothetical protein PLB02_04135 [Thermoanaerobaculia bacterium]|nr:hypothetical protein [Thermoanaerobaculia bacterium]HQR66561.1 hypothetical protein [Thermoanaerobaculia bacterium]